MGKNMALVEQSNWESVVLNSDKPVLVDFSAEWCGPCKMLDPIVDELAGEYDGTLTVVKIDADENPDIVTNYGVMGMPTLMLFKNGEVVERMVGFKPKSKIVNKLVEHL